MSRENILKALKSAEAQQLTLSKPDFSGTLQKVNKTGKSKSRSGTHFFIRNLGFQRVLVFLIFVILVLVFLKLSG